jgi:hypothetical protein
MAAEPSNKRKDRLAAALKENLKRRKAQSRAKATRGAQADGSPQGVGLGTAPQAGLEDQPEAGLKNVRNRT